MEFKVIRIIFDNGTEQVFNFQHVRDLSYNEKNKSAVITIKGNGPNWDTLLFDNNITELYISNLE